MWPDHFQFSTGTALLLLLLLKVRRQKPDLTIQITYTISYWQVSREFLNKSIESALTISSGSPFQSITLNENKWRHGKHIACGLNILKQ